MPRHHGFVRSASQASSVAAAVCGVTIGLVLHVATASLPGSAVAAVVGAVVAGAALWGLNSARPGPGGRRPRALRRLVRMVAASLCACAAVATVAVAVLPRLDDPVDLTPPSWPAGQGALPVVLITGLMSQGTGFAPLVRRLQALGVPVLDFNPTTPGIQPFVFEPRSATDHVPQIAAEVLGPAIDAALDRVGRGTDQRVDVVAHSYGGLLARWLVERVPGWAERVDDLVTVATPHGGSEFGFRLTTLPPGVDEWDGVGNDLRPGSPVLRQLGRHAPAGARYTTIAGDPVALRWLRFGHLGFDGAVPTASALLPGAKQRTIPATHGAVLRDRRTVTLIETTITTSP